MVVEALAEVVFRKGGGWNVDGRGVAGGEDIKQSISWVLRGEWDIYLG